MESPHRQKRHHRPRPNIEWLEFMPLLVFGLLVLLGPLFFGAVDRVVQIGLVLLLGVGLFLQPPALAALSRPANCLVIVVIAVLLVQSFAPHPWFGNARWRSELTQDFNVSLPWT